MPADGTPQAEMQRARRLMAAGARAEAEAIYRQQVRKSWTDAVSLRVLASAQAEVRDFGGARTTLDRALKLRPADVQLLTDVARSWLIEGRLLETLRAVDRVLRLAPEHSPAIELKAQALVLSGDHAGAWEAMRAVIEADAGGPALASSLARVARRVGQQDRAAALIEKHLASSQLSVNLRAELLFRLGDLRDSGGEWDAAFEAYQEANRLQRSLFRFDVAEAAAAVDRLIDAWRPGLDRPRSAVKSDRPVFIVGMPRSGTSLVEQILASHPGVGAGGELQDIAKLAHQWQGGLEGGMAVFTRVEEATSARLDLAARAYLQQIQRLDGRAARVTDKLPINFLSLGLISLMLPGSRAIHCTRDPMDTCLSCYFQNFLGSMPFAYDLRELGVFFRAYRRLMQHWERVLDYPVLTVPYEEMVKDQSGMSRRLVEFVGLPWDDRCLRFYESRRVVLTSSNEQVRRAIYASSVERWRNYEKHLGPLREALNA